MSCDCCGSFRPPTALTPVGPQSVIEVMSSAEIVAGWDAALGVSGGATVAQWNDLGSGGFNLTQAVAGARPTFNAAGGPNGNPSVLFDGIDDFLANAALNLPAPGTTPSFFWSILRQVVWANTQRFWNADGGGASRVAVFSNALTPQIAQADNVVANSHGGLTVNTYKRLEVLFSNSVADYIKAGAATPTTGTSAGNIDPAGPFGLGGFTSGVNPANVEFCELWIFNVLPTPAQLLQLDLYALNRYGASVLA
jgi:hypothetical protein